MYYYKKSSDLHINLSFKHDNIRQTNTYFLPPLHLPWWLRCVWVVLRSVHTKLLHGDTMQQLCYLLNVYNMTKRDHQKTLNHFRCFAHMSFFFNLIFFSTDIYTHKTSTFLTLSPLSSLNQSLLSKTNSGMIPLTCIFCTDTTVHDRSEEVTLSSTLLTSGGNVYM